MRPTNGVTKLVFALGIALALPAHADFIALDSTRTSGNQNWTGPLGMDFDVLKPIWVTKLGAFDGLPVGFSNDIQVGIFDRNTGLLVAPSVTLTTGNTTAEGTNNRFFDNVDFMLGVGYYSIVADGYSTSEPNGNDGFFGPTPTINTGGGLIAFTGSARYGDPSDGLIYPLTIDGGPANRYDAGTFEFTAVPEPGSAALAGVGLLGLVLLRRRKRV